MLIDIIIFIFISSLFFCICLSFYLCLLIFLIFLHQTVRLGFYFLCPSSFSAWISRHPCLSSPAGAPRSNFGSLGPPRSKFGSPGPPGLTRREFESHRVFLGLPRATLCAQDPQLAIEVHRVVPGLPRPFIGNNTPNGNFFTSKVVFWSDLSSNV